jgi:hypothetical protein
VTENQESERAFFDRAGAAAAVPRLIGVVWSNKLSSSRILQSLD